MSQLITDCPHCATRFRLTPEQLEMANGLVRCGKCINVFNAGENSLSAESSEIVGLGAEDSGTKSPITPKQEIGNQTEDSTPLPAMTELLHNEFAVQQPPTKDRTSKPFLAKLLLILAGTLLLTAQCSYFFSRELSQTEAYRKPLASFVSTSAVPLSCSATLTDLGSGNLWFTHTPANPAHSPSISRLRISGCSINRFPRLLYVLPTCRTRLWPRACLQPVNIYRRTHRVL